MLDLAFRGRVAVMTLSRPPVNAIDDAMIASMHGRLDELAKRQDVSVLHLRSSQRLFAAGADIELLHRISTSADRAAVMEDYLERLQGLFNRIESLPQVTLAEINGAALGGGFEMCLACDLRMAAQEAKIGLPEIGIGLFPGAGGTQRLSRLCGMGLAAKLIYTGEPETGTAARDLGMVQWAVPQAELEARAAELADRLASFNPLALRAAKACIGASGAPLENGYRLEREHTRRLIASEETKALLAAFLGKRKSR
ncbi:MAG TPA: enoyl-CoA hydratase-related protein [Burkholderiales bacterium]|nr:enoyl-CoA hydratase-related protein [Burkholderiales bacterium]